MARTHGHGNPNWTREETILALDLYFQCGDKIPSADDMKVQQLSKLLRASPVHRNVARTQTFRNPDGVAFKVQNLHNVATGKGLSNVSEMDRKIWAEFGLHPEKVRTEAELIRQRLGVGMAATAASDYKSRIPSLTTETREEPQRQFGKPFRHSAAFGKRIEYWIIGQMLKEGLDVYVPLVDDQAVDAIVKRVDGSTALVQIKARSRDVVKGDAGLFAAIPHPERREDYWFVFYSERMDMKWIMSSAEFVQESRQNKQGKNAGLRSIWFNGTRKNAASGISEEYCYERYGKYIAKTFDRIAKNIA